jgi:hypothetical protein
MRQVGVTENKEVGEGTYRGERGQKVRKGVAE